MGQPCCGYWLKDFCNYLTPTAEHMNKSIKILIVDDDEDIRANFADILGDLGYQIDVAADGEVALQKVTGKCPERPCSFDLCLLDFKMPGMDGAELYQKIRERCPNVPAIMITAYAGEDGVQKAIDAGTWRVIRKPVDVNSLLGLIQQATS